MSPVRNASGEANLFEIARDEEMLDSLRVHGVRAEATDDITRLLAAWARRIDSEVAAGWNAQMPLSRAVVCGPGPTMHRRGGSYSASVRLGAGFAHSRARSGPGVRARGGATAAAAAGLVLSLSGVAAAVGGARLPALDGLTPISSDAHSRDAGGEVPQVSATDAAFGPSSGNTAELSAFVTGDGSHSTKPQEGAERSVPEPGGSDATDLSWPRVHSARTGLQGPPDAVQALRLVLESQARPLAAMTALAADGPASLTSPKPNAVIARDMSPLTAAQIAGGSILRGAVPRTPAIASAPNVSTAPPALTPVAPPAVVPPTVAGARRATPADPALTFAGRPSGAQASGGMTLRGPSTTSPSATVPLPSATKRSTSRSQGADSTSPTAGATAPVLTQTDPVAPSAVPVMPQASPAADVPSAPDLVFAQPVPSTSDGSAAEGSSSVSSSTPEGTVPLSTTSSDSGADVDTGADVSATSSSATVDADAPAAPLQVSAQPAVPESQPTIGQTWSMPSEATTATTPVPGDPSSGSASATVSEGSLPQAAVRMGLSEPVQMASNAAASAAGSLLWADGSPTVGTSGVYGARSRAS